MRILLSGILLIYSYTALSQCDHRELSLLVENDSALTLGGGTDRFYSNGTELTYRCKQALSDQTQASNYASRSLNLLQSKHNVIGIDRGFRLGHKIYTNSDIGLEDFEIDTDRDRPYAAWLYASIFFEAETLNDAYVSHEASIGCVGPCAYGENFQREWHEFFGFKQPRGWDLQIKNQIALQYFFTYKPARYDVFQHVSLHPRIKVSIGTVFDDISFGGEFIIGDQSNREKLDIKTVSNSWRWQFFLHNDVKMVAFNGTLEGSLFNNSSPHTVEPSRIVLENGIGVRLDYNQYSFQYRFVGRSTELEEQDWKLWDHKYGSLEFAIGF